MHPSKDIIGAKNNCLKDLKIALGITGSVAAIRCPDIARSLMREGAEVRVVMSKSATQMITPEMMHWATGNEVLSELTGSLEHVELAKWADVVVMAPSTANTIGKIANGIDDTPPTSVVSVAQGLGKPIALVPAMHSSMYSHDIIQKNITYLEKVGFRILEPKFEEEKAKVPPVEEIVDFIKSTPYPANLKGKRILVTAGPTIGRLDPVRFLTNKSSGKMGISIARLASNRGADVTLIYGEGTEPEPTGVNTIRVETTEEMFDRVVEELENHYDLIVAAAAPQDFAPEKSFEKKIRRGESLDVKLLPTPGILEKAAEVSSNSYLVGFKAECNVTDGELIEAARAKMEECNLDLIVANDVMREGAGFGTDTNEVILCSSDGTEHIKATKFEIANSILDRYLQDL